MMNEVAYDYGVQRIPLSRDGCNYVGTPSNVERRKLGLSCSTYNPQLNGSTNYPHPLIGSYDINQSSFENRDALSLSQ